MKSFYWQVTVRPYSMVVGHGTTATFPQAATQIGECLRTAPSVRDISKDDIYSREAILVTIQEVT